MSRNTVTLTAVVAADFDTRFIFADCTPASFSSVYCFSDGLAFNIGGNASTNRSAFSINGSIVSLLHSPMRSGLVILTGMAMFGLSRPSYCPVAC